MQSSAKENPNPVVHTTKRSTSTRSSSLSQSLGYEAIRRYNLGAPSPTISITADESSSPFTSSSSYLSAPPTAEEHSVAIALSEAAYVPNADSSLDVLQQAGFALFHPQRIQKECRAIRFPSYSPASVKNPVTHPSFDTDRSRNTDDSREEITSEEVFDIIRNIQDPEHPLTLEQLNVVRMDMVDVVDLSVTNDAVAMDGRQRKFSTVHVQFCPTIPHCSMATLIGLSISVKLLRSLPPRFKVSIKIEPGTHVSEHAINKQLADKERVRAALENDHLLGVVNRCIAGGMKM